MSSLKSGHSEMTTSGNVSEHSTGDAVDIAADQRHTDPGQPGTAAAITEISRQAPHATLQGTMAPHQIISLLDFGANTLALPDHDNHIHVGFRPLLGRTRSSARRPASILKSGQWDKLVQHLGSLDNPTVPTKPSKAALPVTGGRSD